MQFAFMEGKDNMHMPHNYPKTAWLIPHAR